MPKLELPPPEELRRRIRAARALRGVDDLADLAAMVHHTARLSERTLRKLETGESIPTVPQLRELASVLNIAFEWFTHPDVGRAPAEADPSIDDRLALLEGRMQQWEQIADDSRRMLQAAITLLEGEKNSRPETLRSTPPVERQGRR